jgi:acyl-coenzyme A synthetase/AMP-(fatty) acid ligase
MTPIYTKAGLSCGTLLPGIVARVIKADGSLANRNEPGELYLKTPAAAKGYLGDEIAYEICSQRLKLALYVYYSGRATHLSMGKSTSS